jgi:solute carrier family 15 oligopeptide transporter 1
MSKELEKGDQEVKDPKDEAKKYPYPKSVFIIISTEFCERFSFYGMKTVLALFFKEVLNFDDDVSTLLYHAFTAICYFTPIFGAILADSFVGKFRTIFYISIIYAIGQIVLTIGAVGNTENGNEGISGLPANAMAYIGLLLIAIGTGGIKPCVASFGGEQFKLPEQAPYMKSFFSMFYAAINGGSLISTILTPILRQETTCFGQESCYPAAFGVPAALMVIAILIFLSGRIVNSYTLVTPVENIIVKTTKCIWYCFRQKGKAQEKEKKDSFMDYGLKKYGKNFIDDVKALGNIVYMFLPFPIFWALFDQQGSRWTFQATRMNGDTFGFVVLPDMMQVSNPILILAFIPIFDYVVYPILSIVKKKN